MSPISESVLGVHDGHNAAVALVRDGRVEIALQEERLTRIKNQGDIPSGAIREALALATELRTRRPRVGLSGRYMKYGQWSPSTIVADYERCGGWLSKFIKQPLKSTFIDRSYQHHQARIRE